jgi:hypothetical protein
MSVLESLSTICSATSLECANLLALWYFYQSGDKSPHSKEATVDKKLILPAVIESQLSWLPGGPADLNIPS